MVRIAYPNILDFISNDIIAIDFADIDNINNFKNIRFILDSLDLTCHDGTYMKKCTVSRVHFENKLSGYYYTYNLNNNNEYSIYYNLVPFKVILPENNIYLRIRKAENRQNINVGQNGIIYFTTHYDDTERNIFNINDIEDNT